MAGRIFLIKSAINALPLFYLSFFKAPSKICSLIRKIQANFLLGWGYEGRKIVLVAWDKVCSPIEVGGSVLERLGN